MTTSFIYPIIRRSNRNMIILCAAIAVLLIGLAAYNARYLYNFFAGRLRVNDSGYLALGLGVLLFGVCMFGIVRAIRRNRNPLAHPIMRALNRFGSPTEIAGQIDAELLVTHPRVDRLHLTHNWLVQASSSSLTATRIDDIVWTYKQVTQRRVNGVPAGKSYTAQIWDRHGVCITVAGSEIFVNQAIEAAVRRAPWMLAGYNTDLEKAWKSNRAAVLAAVDQRRALVAAQLS